MSQCGKIVNHVTQSATSVFSEQKNVAAVELSLMERRRSDKSSASGSSDCSTWRQKQSNVTLNFKRLTANKWHIHLLQTILSHTITTIIIDSLYSKPASRTWMTSEWKVRLLITEQFQVALIFIVFFSILWKPVRTKTVWLPTISPAIQMSFRL